MTQPIRHVSVVIISVIVTDASEILWHYDEDESIAFPLDSTSIRVAAVRFGPVQRPFFPNPEPEPGSVRALRLNPNLFGGPVRFGSGSGPDPFRTLDRTRTTNFALLAYVITKKSRIEGVVYRKKRQIDALW